MVYRDDSQVYASSEAHIARFEIPSEPPKLVTRANSRLNGVVSVVSIYNKVHILTSSLLSSSPRAAPYEKATLGRPLRSRGEKTLVSLEELEDCSSRTASLQPPRMRM